ncbi:gp1 [Marine RNA virus SF-2]|uniref:Gp1 n=1 Tax=Marine RNA virus SF-2 TaxID=1416631 RepID=U5Y451_9VIRU|nr:gp1 [Marine RNA virus SF-2]AGZ83339.2 gp1 [Marine RNA virus SF-2]
MNTIQFARGLRLAKVAPHVMLGSDTDCVPVRRSQVKPVTVTHSPVVRVYIQKGLTRTVHTFFTVHEVYALVRERLAKLQGPSWCRNHFKIAVTYRGRLLADRAVGLVEYGIRDGETLHVEVSGALCGGAPAGMLVGGDFYPNVVDTWCARKKARSRKLDTFTRLSHEFAPTDRQRKVVVRRERSLEERAEEQFEKVRLEVQASNDYMATAQSFVRTLDNAFDTDFVKMMEDVLVFMMLLSRARAKTDIMLAVLVFVKLRTSHALVADAMASITTLVDALFAEDGPQIQALEDHVTSFRDMMGKWEESKETVIGKKYLKLMKYLVSFGVFSCIGVKPTEKNLKRSADMNESVNHADFLYCVVDTLSFTLQRGLMFARTGEWSVFLHGPKTYAAWFDKCLDVKRKAYSMGNLEAQGTDYFSFVAQIKECIEEGHAIVKFASRDLKSELKAAKFMLHEILMIEASVLTKKSAQQERRAPFAVLLHGESSVAKSMFQKMLFYYYGKLMNLPTGDDYKFVRNPTDPFWSGFSSQVWCIFLDDVGFLNPAKATEDLSLLELIALVNNVPLVPNQADLADKGKTPVRARLVVASTNTKDMNASNYFACPLAVQRRLPWVITVTPRPEFERADAVGMIDPLKMSALDGDWPDFWTISVDKVIPAGKAGNRAMASFENVKVFGNTQDFLDWFGPVCKTFDAIQAKAMVDDCRMKDIELCQLCNRSTPKCTCVQAHNEFVIPEGYEFGQNFELDYEDGPILERKNYMFDGKSYMCHTTFYRDGVFVRDHVSPVSIRKTPEVQAVSQVDYADILNEVVERQKPRCETRVQKVTAWCITAVLKLYIRHSIVRRTADWIVSFAIVRTVIKRVIMDFVPPSEMARTFFSFVGVFVERTMTPARWRKLLLGLTATVSAWITYRKMCNWSVQGSNMSVPDTHFKKNEKENVWKRDDYQTTAFDVDPMSANYASLPTEQVVAKIRRNCARIFVGNEGQMSIPGNAFCVGGHLWVTNNHILPEDGDLTVKFKVDPDGMGASRNVTFRLEQSSIYRESGSDLAYFEIFAVDARADLTRLISSATLDGQFVAKYVGLNRDCSPRDTQVRAVVKTSEHCAAHDRVYTYWRGMVEQDTVNGDCGTVMVGIKPTVAILGLHQLGGSRNMAFAVKLTQSSLARARGFFTRPLIQASAPRISSNTVKKVVGPLRHRSPLRWLKEGSITVFGSFTGYIVRQRSQVRSTLCGEYIKNIRNWDVPFGRPDLSDWRPWHLAYKDTVNQENIASRSIIKQAVAGYVADVCAGLSEDDKANMRIISDHAAINGIARVQYLDKMNFNSSIGEPFNKSKKWFLTPAPTEEQPDAKMFDEEIMQRAADIEANYRKGIRACPVFSGQLKDEPRAQAKIDAGKVRVFTGAPGDWSFVVRKYLLSFVKVVQENKLLFEAAPGCVTQSLEWEKYREYLTKFGDDQIVAGDYGKFDKKMTAEFILAAYDAITQILKFAGWTDTDLLVVFGIAEDTAYAYINCHGDLVMTYGANPSGHPLTVIINSIVNALYLRYCYIKLNPTKECDTFKEKVTLLTYGDDNVMGVSKSIPWFNHTEMVRVLASIGVEYTMADKESVSRPYINISEVAFLKRTWRWDEDVGAYLCPLDEESIHKMLCVNIPSKTISEEAQMLEVMRSAVDEFFFYGRDRFEREVDFLKQVIATYRLTAEYDLKPFPTWEVLRERFWRASEGIYTKRLGVCYSRPE